ncbi:MAG: type II toxin-antitoxin system RelE/ParE family toxin [Geopsychrobacter sp.]|nr:type II toxin-antitoxin system RelE/ParE family toxin [Geopsychrobacter sp.]
MILNENTIEWHNKARKQLKKLPRNYQLAIVEAVDVLEQPQIEWRNVVELKNHSCDCRMRVGRYRVLFDYDDGIRVVAIQEVRKRDERTY